MKAAFKQIVKITVSHTYFKNNVCPALQFAPDANTSLILDRYGFKVRKCLDGFEIYSSFKGEQGAQFNYIKTAMETDCFVFEITTSDALFYTYTDLPDQWIGSINYATDSLKQEANDEMNPSYKKESDTKVVGTVKINFSDLTDTENNYSINYDARLTVLNYYIINKGQLTLDNPEIDTKGKVDFSSPTNVKLVNGENALSFTSTESIALNENPDTTFDLVEESGQNNRPKIIFRGLPNPSPQNTQVEVVDGVEKFRTNMYVYL